LQLALWPRISDNELTFMTESTQYKSLALHKLKVISTATATLSLVFLHNHK